jgi:hypothetical protein
MARLNVAASSHRSSLTESSSDSGLAAPVRAVAPRMVIGGWTGPQEKRLTGRPGASDGVPGAVMRLEPGQHAGDWQSPAHGGGLRSTRGKVAGPVSDRIGLQRLAGMLREARPGTGRPVRSATERARARHRMSLSCACRTAVPEGSSSPCGRTTVTSS